MVLLLVACTASPTQLLAPDPARSGEDGDLGPFGAVSQPLQYPARATELVNVDFVYPADADGAPADVEGGWPLIVFVQGAAVAPERYHWFAEHLASRGYAVALPSHPSDFAIFAVGNARVARAGIAKDYAGSLSGTTAIAGHSLGGVVSVIDWVAEPAFDAILLAASYPDAGTDPALRAGSPALSLVGSEDKLALPDVVKAGADRLDPVFFGVVAGMNHFDWTDDPLDKELAKDGTSTGTEACRLATMRVVDTFFDASLRNDADAAERLQARDFAGVEVAP